MPKNLNFIRQSTIALWLISRQSIRQSCLDMSGQGRVKRQRLIVKLGHPRWLATAQMALQTFCPHHFAGGGQLKPLLHTLVGSHFWHWVALSFQNLVNQWLLQNKTPGLGGTFKPVNYNTPLEFIQIRTAPAKSWPRLRFVSTNIKSTSLIPGK